MRKLMTEQRMRHWWRMARAGSWVRRRHLQRQERRKRENLRRRLNTWSKKDSKGAAIESDGHSKQRPRPRRTMVWSACVHCNKRLEWGKVCFESWKWRPAKPKSTIDNRKKDDRCFALEMNATKLRKVEPFDIELFFFHVPSSSHIIVFDGMNQRLVTSQLWLEEDCNRFVHVLLIVLPIGKRRTSGEDEKRVDRRIRTNKSPRGRGKEEEAATDWRWKMVAVTETSDWITKRVCVCVRCSRFDIRDTSWKVSWSWSRCVRPPDTDKVIEADDGGRKKRVCR